MQIESDKNDALGTNRTHLGHSDAAIFEFLNDPAVASVGKPSWPERGEPVLWTDDYGSLWQVLSD